MGLLLQEIESMWYIFQKKLPINRIEHIIYVTITFAREVLRSCIGKLIMVY